MVVTRCGFRAKWGTDSDGKWGAITTQVGRGFDGEVGHFSARGRNGAPPSSERCPINFVTLPISLGTGRRGWRRWVIPTRGHDLLKPKELDVSSYWQTAVIGVVI